MTQEQKELLTRILNHLEPSNVTTLEYRTPSASLRRSADLLDQKERDINDLKKMLGMKTFTDYTYINGDDLTAAVNGTCTTTTGDSFINLNNK